MKHRNAYQDNPRYKATNLLHGLENENSLHLRESGSLFLPGVKLLFGLRWGFLIVYHWFEVLILFIKDVSFLCPSEAYLQFCYSVFPWYLSFDARSCNQLWLTLSLLIFNLNQSKMANILFLLYILSNKNHIFLHCITSWHTKSVKFYTI